MVRERYRQVFAQEIDLTLAEHRLGQKDVIGSLTDVQVLPDSLVPISIRQRIARSPDVPSDTTAMRNLKRLHDAGLTPREILTAATTGGARLMGRDDLGTIAPGTQADLVVLNENPLTDIMHTTAIHRVVKKGRLFAPDSLLPRTPEAVVLQGRNAYNTHDAEAFLDVFAPDLKVFDHPNTLVSSGRDTLAAQYRPRFQRATDLHVQLQDLTTMGTTVLIHERLSGLPDRETPLNQVVLYRVTDGAIDRAWLVQDP